MTSIVTDLLQPVLESEVLPKQYLLMYVRNIHAEIFHSNNSQSYLTAVEHRIEFNFGDSIDCIFSCMFCLIHMMT